MTLRITSAYNFVPLSRQVVQPDWQNLVSHDLPLQDGLCAELDVELEAHTPLLVGAGTQRGADQGPAVVRPYKLPDGRPAIPGSSVRGMLRNVVEIATHARLAPVMDNRAMSLRDLSSSDNDYVKQLVDGQGIRKEHEGAKPKARSGWLWFDGADWRLEAVAHARVEQDLIKQHFGLSDRDWPAYQQRDDRKHWRKGVIEKRKTLIAALQTKSRAATLKNEHLLVRFKPLRDQFRNMLTVHAHSGGNYLAYNKVERLVDMGSGETAAEGVLVCTGQPGPGKHMEFVFLPFAKKPDSPVIDPAVMAAFQQVHDDPEGDWKNLWKGLAARSVPVPVFFLTDELGQVSSLGLAQMYRLAGKHRLGALAEAAQDALPPGRLDFAQTLFGHVQEEHVALKGRISVGDFTPVAGTPCTPAASRFNAPTVLGAPKPSFYPSYFQQKAQNGRLTAASFSTILSAEAPTLRGWKRYPVRTEAEANLPPPPERANAKVQVRLEPLAAGCKFRGTIRLHNVKPAELGALLWALDFGQPPGTPSEPPALRHALGMGKPFGLGQVSLRLHSPLHVRPNDPQAPAPTEAALREAFEQYMEAAVPGWGQSSTLKELRAMANPLHPHAKSAYLNPLSGPKEFMEVKKRGKAAVLPAYTQLASAGQPGGPAPRPSAPGTFHRR